MVITDRSFAIDLLVLALRELVSVVEYQSYFVKSIRFLSLFFSPLLSFFEKKDSVQRAATIGAIETA